MKGFLRRALTGLRSHPAPRQAQHQAPYGREVKDIQGPDPVAPHGWRECGPLVLLLVGDGEEASPQAKVEMERSLEALKAVMRRLSRADQDAFRRAFHHVSCLNSRDQADLVVTNRVLDLIDVELQRPDYG